MPLKALILANAAMLLFAMVVAMHSYSGLSAGDLIGRMQQAGMVKDNSAAS